MSDHLVATANPEAVRLLDDAVRAYAGARRDTHSRLAAVFAADPGCVMAHVLDGYLSMLSSHRQGTAHARQALASAERGAARGATRRELLHNAALDRWSNGDMRGAAATWDVILDKYPRDLLALKVSQFVLSYLGESARMRDRVATVLPAWSDADAEHGFVLGCYAYALEESGEYRQADEAGRRAVALNARDIWAAHAVAHVAEMEGRHHDGIEWIAALSGEWKECTNFALHLRWHEGLYHLELEEYERALVLYDREVRAEPTDEYLDVTNAVSLLWRLEQSGVDVGARWGELAARAATHLDDHALVFVDLHYLMAMAAASAPVAVAAFLQSCERFAASGAGTEAEVMGEVGLPLAHAVVAHRNGRYGDVVDLLLPVRHLVRRIGASHAQRDLFEQLLIDAAWRAHRFAEAAQLLDARLTRRPGNRWGLRHQRVVKDSRRGAGSARAGATDRQTAD